MTEQLHIIVQAGGRGSRLRHHTWNKPKCLVSVQGKPLLYHLFDRFPAAQFSVIGDYAYEQLEKYLQINPPGVSVTLVRAGGHGTSSGIAEALDALPAAQPVVLVWSDLVLTAAPEWPDTDKAVVFTTAAFTCRWTVSPEGKLHEVPGNENGVPGLFYFPRADLFPAPPAEGEFVKWLAANMEEFEVRNFDAMQELGDFATLESANDAAGFSRFFNEVTISDAAVEKRAVDPAYANLIDKELGWYREASRLGFRRIPKILSERPFVMERVQGQHLYQIHDLSLREQRAVMADYLDALTALHDKSDMQARSDEVIDVYQHKTISRVRSVAAIIPGFDKESMTINGRKCRNVFAPRHEGVIESLMPRLMPERFTPIHGDATFSNTLIDNKLRTWFIDPRGYFSKPGIMGDPWYDFAKVYYSAVGGYDAFNRRKFKLHIDDETVEVLLEEPRYANTAREIFADYFGAEVARIEILHGLIWLALSGYARDDLDSVIGSFYLGLYWLESGTARL
jgi:GTP:adenosylcobinamide-phosphate guanylyltransferase